MEFERNKQDCKFKPMINKQTYMAKSPPKNKDIYGMDKIIERMKKGREEAEFKKRMTERSNFTAAGGIKKAKKFVKQGGIPVNNVNAMFGGSNTTTKFKNFGTGDGAQIKHNKQVVINLKERAPLYLPK